MNFGGKTDKKIFIGLVVLIVLTIFLVVGIAFISQPQPTAPRAQTPDVTPTPIVDVITEETPTEKPTETVVPTISGTNQQPTQTVPLSGAPTSSPSGTLTSVPTGTSGTTTPTGTSGTATPTPTVKLISQTGTTITASPSATRTPTPTTKSSTSTTAPTSSTFATSTPVPTAAQTLPVTGVVHVTILVFTVGLLVMMLGLAL